MVANTTNATSLFIPQSIIESQIASCLSANKKNYHPWLSFSTSFYLLGSDQSRVSFIISVNLSTVILNSFNFNIYITVLEFRNLLGVFHFHILPLQQDVGSFCSCAHCDKKLISQTNYSSLSSSHNLSQDIQLNKRHSIKCTHCNETSQELRMLFSSLSEFQSLTFNVRSFCQELSALPLNH